MSYDIYYMYKEVYRDCNIGIITGEMIDKLDYVDCLNSKSYEATD